MSDRSSCTSNSGSSSSSSSPDASSQSSFFNIKLVPVQDSPKSATRAHFRSSKVMEFEGRKDVRTVWLCDAAPTSPFTEVPPLHNHSASSSESSENGSSTTQDGGSPITSALRLGQRPPLVHSETVPDVHVADIERK